MDQMDRKKQGRTVPIWQKYMLTVDEAVQYFMGHSDIGVTLNTYTHLGAEDAKEELGKFVKMA